MGLEPEFGLRKGSTNASMPFSEGLLNSFKCEGIWWDTICIPKEKAARSKAINKEQSNYEDAQITLVRDCFLREWEWVNAETACFAIIMSPWFSRGWGSLELVKSRKVKVISYATNSLRNRRCLFPIQLTTEFGDGILLTLPSNPGRTTEGQCFLNSHLMLTDSKARKEGTTRPKGI
jgi:hypothetical protein